MRRRRFIGMYRGLRKSMVAVAPRQKAKNPRRPRARTLADHAAAHNAAPERTLGLLKWRARGTDSRRAVASGDDGEIGGVAAAPRRRYIRAKLSGKPREADDDLRRPQGLLREEVRP